MKTTIECPIEVNIVAVRMVLPVKYGTWDMLDDYPCRKGDTWEATVDMDTGQIRDWPAGWPPHRLYMKVADGASFFLLDPEGRTIAEIRENYVPHGVVPGKYGEYVDIEIDANGVIANWPKNPDVSGFSEYGTVTIPHSTEVPNA